MGHVFFFLPSKSQCRVILYNIVVICTLIFFHLTIKKIVGIFSLMKKLSLPFLTWFQLCVRHPLLSLGERAEFFFPQVLVSFLLPEHFGVPLLKLILFLSPLRFNPLLNLSMMISFESFNDDSNFFVTVITFWRTHSVIYIPVIWVPVYLIVSDVSNTLNVSETNVYHIIQYFILHGHVKWPSLTWLRIKKNKLSKLSSILLFCFS